MRRASIRELLINLAAGIFSRQIVNDWIEAQELACAFCERGERGARDADGDFGAQEPAPAVADDDHRPGAWGALGLAALQAWQVAYQPVAELHQDGFNFDLARRDAA